MPHEDGIHFAESLRGTLVQCPIIMISSGSTPMDVELGQKYGISRFMNKPVIASELLNEVLRQFGRYTAAKPQSPSETPQLQVQPRRVLLVEDNEINRRVALGLLKARGHQAVVAENGKEAVSKLADEEFDVVLMDMQMPIMDGYEATAAIRFREHQTGGHMPIVAMTAEALKGDRERCLAVGMDDYVSKPIAPAELYRSVERFPAVCLAPTVGRSNPHKIIPTPTPTKERPDPPKLDIANEPQYPASQSNLPVINWSLVNESLGGATKELHEFSAVVKNESSNLLADIRRAIEDRDSKLLVRFAHTFKGTINYFGVETLVEAALALEKLGRTGAFDSAQDLMAKLELEYSRFLTALEIGPPNSRF
jgi:CheY-like chemotaxis protein